MDTFRFYPLQIDKHEIPNIAVGDLVPIDYLLDMVRAENRNVFADNYLVESFTRFDFDPLARKRTSYLERAIATMVFCICGQVPSRQEILRGRQIIERLPRDLKKSTALREFCLSFLPYLIIGTNSHLESQYREESNWIEDVVRFARRCYTANYTIIESYLCAHRESDQKRPYGLVKHVATWKAKRALNLQMALIANSQHNNGKIIWIQQPATKAASSNMFPELFLRYFHNAEIPVLLLELDTHFAEIHNLFSIAQTETIQVYIRSIDMVNEQIQSNLSINYGTNWRAKDFGSLRATEFDLDLLEIAQQHTLPEVIRLMPYYKNKIFLTGSEFNLLLRRNIAAAERLEDEGMILQSGYELKQVTIDSIQYFFDSQKMHVDAKALFEANFYYLWGCVSAEQDYIGMALERDHTKYQIAAWKLGYIQRGKSSLDNAAPFIIARRTPREIKGGYLKDISFRQFWREE